MKLRTCADNSKPTNRYRPLITLLLCVILGITFDAVSAPAAEELKTDGELRKPITITDHGDSVRDLLYARTFRLETPYTYLWSAEKHEVTEGYLLVISVDPEFIKPRQTDVPVLFVGNTPAEVTNFGYISGNAIAIIPGALDLTTTPIFFGSLELPERIDSKRGEAELSMARNMGIAPLSRARIDVALAAGGDEVIFADQEELYAVIGDLIERYSPAEKERAAQYRGDPE